MSEYANDSVDGFNTSCRCEKSISRACCRPSSNPEDGGYSCDSGRLTPVEFRPALLGSVGEAARTIEASDATESWVDKARVRLSADSPPDDEGETARIVDLRAGGVVSSSSTSSSVSKSFNSAWPGVDGGVLPGDNLREYRELDVPTRVSSSDVLVDTECLKVFFGR